MNYIDFHMKSSDRIREVHKKIVKQHGRVENIRVFDQDYTKFEKPDES